MSSVSLLQTSAGGAAGRWEEASTDGRDPPSQAPSLITGAASSWGHGPLKRGVGTRRVCLLVLKLAAVETVLWKNEDLEHGACFQVGPGPAPHCVPSRD